MSEQVPQVPQNTSSPARTEEENLRENNNNSNTHEMEEHHQPQEEHHHQPQPQPSPELNNLSENEEKSLETLSEVSCLLKKPKHPRFSEPERLLIETWSERPFKIKCIFDHGRQRHQVWFKMYIQNGNGLDDVTFSLEALLAIPTFLENEKNFKTLLEYIAKRKTLKRNIENLYSQIISPSLLKDLLGKTQN